MLLTLNRFNGAEFAVNPTSLETKNAFLFVYSSYTVANLVFSISIMFLILLKYGEANSSLRLVIGSVYVLFIKVCFSSFVQKQLATNPVPPPEDSSQ